VILLHRLGAASSVSIQGMAASNNNIGLFALGTANDSTSLNTIDEYLFSTDAVATGTVLITAAQAGAASSNQGDAIFALGFTTAAVTTRNKYTYSGNVVASATAASTASAHGSAAGNSLVGIFALGNNGTQVTSRDRYTYSGDTVTTGRCSNSRILYWISSIKWHSKFYNWEYLFWIIYC